jgi:hypothetical protein
LPRRGTLPPTYLDAIRRDRTTARSPAPLAVRRDYPSGKRAALKRDLARHYEACKREPRNRGLTAERRKNYCSRVAWTIVRRSGRYPDYPTFAKRRGKGAEMKRDHHGRFVKYRARSMAKRSHRRSHASSPRRHRRRARAVAYTHRRRRAHMVAAPAPRRRRVGAAATTSTPHRRRRRASASRRRSGSRRGGARPVIVVANSPRRRSYRRPHHARSAPLFTLGGMMTFGVGGIFGAEAADLLTRYFLGLSPTTTPLPTGVTSIASYNDVVMAAPPSLKRVAIELGVSLLGWIGGGLAARAGMSLLSLFGYGWGFGATFHLGSAIIDGYLLQPLFVGSTSTPNAIGQQMFQHEINASAARATAVAAGGTLGAPVNRAGTPVLPPQRPTTHVPAALAQLGPRRAPATLGQQASSASPCAPCSAPGVDPGKRCGCGGGCAQCQQQQQQPQPASPPAVVPMAPAAPPAQCPPGMQYVQVIDGSWACQPIPQNPQNFQPILPIPQAATSPFAAASTAASMANGTQGLGQPPAGGPFSPYQHPMMRSLLNGPSWLRRAA